MTRSSKVAAVLCAIGAVGCASATAMAAEPSGAPKPASRRATMPVEGATIANPEWAQLPNGEVMANYYPPLARLLELPGTARMQCNVTTAGALDGCVILEETPAGIGFGNATLGVAQYFRMKPMTVDGAPVGGGKVIIPIKWQMGDRAPVPDPNAEGPPPSPEALALGRRLIAAMGETSRLTAAYQAAIAHVASTGGTPEGQAALAALDKAVDAKVGIYGEEMAVAYARTFSVAELQGLVTFFESPTGQAWRTQQQTVQKAEQYAAQKTWEHILADVRRDLCAKAVCLPETTAADSPDAKPAKTDQGAKP